MLGFGFRLSMRFHQPCFPPLNLGHLAFHRIANRLDHVGIGKGIVTTLSRRAAELTEVSLFVLALMFSLRALRLREDLC